jgi:hypothetical protein
MRIKRYHVASAPNAGELQNEVSKLISEGWQPFGQMVIAEPSNDTHARFFQVLVQYEGEIRS